MTFKNYFIYFFKILTLRPSKKQNSNIPLFPSARVVVASTPFTLGLPGEIFREKFKKKIVIFGICFFGVLKVKIWKNVIKWKLKSVVYLIFSFQGNRAIFEITRVFFSFTKSAENSTNFCQIFGEKCLFQPLKVKISKKLIK